MPGPSILRLEVEFLRRMLHHPTKDTAGSSQSAPVTAHPPNQVQPTPPTTDSEPTPPAARCSVFQCRPRVPHGQTPTNHSTRSIGYQNCPDMDPPEPPPSLAPSSLLS